MQTRLILHRWLLTAWFMLWGSVCAWAYMPAPQTAQYPSYSQWEPVSQTSQMASSPTYQFRSTSVYAPSMEHNASFVPLADQTVNGPRNGRIRKGGFDEEENEIGVVDNPIGDVAWGAIFLCAALYLALRALRRKVE